EAKVVVAAPPPPDVAPSAPAVPEGKEKIEEKPVVKEPESKLADGEVRRLSGHESARVEAIAVALDGGHPYALSAGSDWTVRYWDVVSGQELRSFPHDRPVFAVASSPDGLRALSGGGDKTLRLWDVKTGLEIHRFEGHTRPIYGVAYAPDGLRVVSAGGDNTV